MNLTWILFLSLFSTLSFSHEYIRPFVPDDFLFYAEDHSDPTRHQIHYFVPGAKVAYANYEAIRRDFPSLAGLTDKQIDEWIVENFSHISKMQMQLQGIRVSHFNVDLNKSKIHTHPYRYDRASVAEAFYNGSRIGMVDLKGSGSSNETKVNSQVEKFNEISSILDTQERENKLNRLHIEDHSDGAMTLGESIAEVSRQLAVQAGFDLYNAEHRTGHETVESYFILSLPIKVLKEGNHYDYAAIYGRQAHFGRINKLKSPTAIYSDDFGNRQSSFYLSAIDFGAVVIRQKELTGPESFGDPKNYIVKGEQGQPIEDAQLSNAWRQGHEAANAFIRNSDHSYELAREQITNHLADMLKPIQSRLKEIRKISDKERKLRYLVDRISAVPNMRHRPVVVDRLLEFDTQTLAPELPRIFSLYKLPNSVVEPIFKNLLSREDVKYGSEVYQRLIQLAQRYAWGISGRSDSLNFYQTLLNELGSRKSPSLLKFYIELFGQVDAPHSAAEVEAKIKEYPVDLQAIKQAILVKQECRKFYTR